jgi:recombination protein RecT
MGDTQEKDGPPAGQSRLQGAAVERQAPPQAVQFARKWEGTFAEVLPSFVEPKGFVGSAVAALRKSDDLLAAANNDLTRFTSVLIECARLGHVPGSKEFYLTVRNEKVGNRWVPKVMGIEGYRGVIERMYRSGAVASVVVREVCKNDRFEFVEGVHDVPVHHVEWFAEDDRSSPENIIGVYAYARLTTGTTSRVVVLSAKDIENTKARSDAGKANKGPWVTDYRAMVLKTAAHRLEPWVPTSAEYRSQMLRSAVQAESLREREDVQLERGDVDGDVVDAEVVADSPG